jgi:phage baseplate assembly protein W
MSRSTADEILGAGLAFPLGVDARGAIALAHAAEDVQQAIAMILSTAPGERPMRPEFGCRIHEFVFDRVDASTIGRVEHEVRVSLERWEPRIEVVSVGIDTTAADRGQLLVDLRYQLATSNSERNLVFPFYLIPAEDEV